MLSQVHNRQVPRPWGQEEYTETHSRTTWHFITVLKQLALYLSHIIIGSVVKNPLANTGDERDPGSIPGSGRSPGEGNGNPLQFSCLEIPTEEPGRLQSMGS